MTPNSPRAELAAAIRAVNAAYGQLDESAHTRVEIVADDAMEAALLDGTPALEEIRDWRDRQLAAIEEAAR